MQNHISRFFTGLAVGGLITAGSGAAAASFLSPEQSINGLVVCMFVAVVSGIACVIGGAQ